MIVFGPIPSRRLGRSLGINNIPPKTCSYSCIYCQVGKTDLMSIQRKEFFSPDLIYNEVAAKIEQLKKADETIDYLSFVPDGEPTIDINLGKTIKRLKAFGIKIAVITNSSLLWDKDVKNDLLNADLVSLKIDSVFQKNWRKINRPHGLLELNKIMKGIEDFSNSFKGKLITETMLVKGINDSIESLYKTAGFIKQIHPEKAYVLVPTRPPAEANIKVPEDRIITEAHQIFSSVTGNAKLLVYDEDNNFSFFSDIEQELLSIVAVHPMRKDAVKKFLNKSNSSWDLIINLIKKKILREIEFAGNTYFIKNR